MQNVSSSYLEKIKEPSRSFECRVTIGNNVYTNIDIINISIEDVQPSDGFTIGAAVSKSLELTLSTNNTIYSNSKVKLEIGLNIGSTFEYILIGNFHIEDIISTDYSTKLTCYDNMIKFEKPYFSNLGKTSSLKNIVNELATITGVEFTGSLPSYNLNKLEGFTCREILGFVASICGGNAYITRDGKFTIKTPATIDYSITSDNYIDLKSEEDLYKVGAITCKANDKELTKGTLSNSSMEIAFENPWVTESILTDIYNKLKGFEFIGYSMKWQGDFSLDVGDIISITDTKGNTRQVPIFSQKLTYNGGLTSEIGAKGESKTKNEFSPTGDLNNKVNRVVTDLLIVNKALINKADIEDLKAVNAEIENLIAQNVTITGKLNAIEGEFGTLKVNVGVIDKLTVTHTAQINALEANKASIVQLEAVSAKIGTVEAEVGKINTLLAGNLTGGNIQAGGITSDKLTIANGFITNAMIANLDVSKINAGDISTNKFKIKSDNGGIEIVGATQQFKDKNNRVRIQMGQDTKGNFNFIIRGEDGTTTLIDHTGIKEKAIADDLIKETMIAQDAIGEKQINYSSFITGFNKDTNTNTIKSTKIMLNNQNQTLDVAFSQLKTQADGTKTLTESHSTTIGVMQGQISTAINNTQIVKDGQTILLKDDYNRTVQTIDSMKSTIGSHTSQISGLNSTVSTQGSSIEQLKGQIALKVEQTDINNAINNMEIGGRNIFLNSSLTDNLDKWSLHTTSPTFTTKDNKKCAKISGALKSGRPIYQDILGKLEPNTAYTMSGWVYTENIVKGETNFMLSYYIDGFYDKYGTSTWFGCGQKDLPLNSNKWVYLTWTFTTDTRVSTATTLNAYLYARDFTGNVYFYNLKLEKGNKATDWTPAPEDTQGQLDAHTTQITTTNNKVASIETNLSSITSRVSSVEQTQVSTNGKVTSLETWKKDAEKKITSDAIISTVTSSQTYKDALTGKVSTNQIISSINQTAEAIKIQANKIDMTGDLDLQGQFKCWKNNSNKTGNYLYLNGAMMYGYNKTGGNYPVFASGLWTDENMGYVSVGYTRADVTDVNGCLYMSPQEGNQGGRLTFSRLKNSQPEHTTLYFQKDGAIDFYSGLRGLYENDDNYTYRFDAGTSVKALRCNRLRSYDIYPRGNNTYDIGFTNGGCFSNIWGNNICTNQSHLYLGTAQASGAWNTYGALAINSATGYIFPAKYNGALGLGMSNNRFSGLYSVNAVNVSSDSRLKTDIHYLEEPTGETVILENRVERNMHITTKDMYDFVKDELKLASYRYNINLEKGNTSVDYGFIAQDILYTKVGSEIVQLADENNLNSELSYNQGNYISVIAGALQQEIRKRDKEIKELRLEIENLKSQRKLEVA